MQTDTTHASVLDSLPGIAMPVAAVPEALTHMWDSTPTETRGAPSAYRASQMNLILHFGVKTGVEEAHARFDTAIAFAQLYPCRIIVLCPGENEGDNEVAMRAKLYSQCFIGESHREMCCCEALILGYHTMDSRFLEDQVSVWVESDLPVYYWFHRVPANIVAERYLPFLKECRRVVYDSAVDGGEMESLAWERQGILSDLAWARILPLRQSLGQFLSGFAPDALVEGLRKFTVRATPARLNEARNLACWLVGGLLGCLRTVGEKSPKIPPYEHDRLPDKGSESIEIEFTYADPRKFFRWRHNADSSISILSANLTGKSIELPVPIRSLTTAEALAEGLFF